jgi:TolB protein
MPLIVIALTARRSRTPHRLWIAVNRLSNSTRRWNVFAHGVAALGLVATLLTAAFVPDSNHSTPVPPEPDPGVIAYVRRAPNEIRLIQPDGTQDRRLWLSSDPDSLDGVLSLAWAPDGSQLAFSSDHESTCSWYQSDVYAVQPNSRGLRRVTNAPACALLANYPQGAVTVGVGATDDGLYWAVVQGSSELKMFTLAAGDYTQLTFEHVADLGPGVYQPAMGIHGHYRYLPLLAADVLPGKTVDGSSILIDESHDISDYGTGKVTWRSDGTQIGYAMRNCRATRRIPLYPPDAAEGTDLPKRAGLWPCLLDMATTAAKADQFLYSVAFNILNEEAEGIYLASTADSSGGEKLLSEADFRTQFGFYGTGGTHDLEWLPDGSGFLMVVTYIYVNIDDPDPVCMGTCSDVFAYDFASSALTQVTRFHDDAARSLSISPDGQQMVVQRVTGDPVTAESSIWLVRRDGTDAQLLVDDAWSAAWGPTAPPLEEAFLPLVTR